MPVARIPLVGSFNQRTIDASMALDDEVDQRFLNCTFSVVQNPVTQKAVVYVERRPGWGVDSLVDADEISTGLIKTESFNAVISAFGDTDSIIYDGTVNVGTITGRAMYFSETLISSTGYVLIKSSDGTGWYYADDAKDQTSYTGDTNTNTTVDNIASTAGMYSGQAISGTDIPAGTRIESVDSSTAITLDTAATGTSAGVTLTKTPIAKILDADFVTTGDKVTAFVEMDGYLFYANADGKIYNSNLNSITAYTATDFKAAQMSPDPPNAVARHKNTVVCWGHSSMEVFHNAGYATGSPLERSPQFFSRHGALDQRSVATLADDIYFVSSAKYGDVAVMRLRNLAPQPISPSTVNKILGTISATSGNIYLSAFQLGGYSYVSAFATTASDEVSLRLLESGEFRLLETGDNLILEADPNAAASFVRLLVYCVELNTWSEWDCNQATYVIGVGSGSVNQILATSRVNDDGKVYKISPSSQGGLYADDGTVYTMEVRTAKLDHGTDNYKFIKSIRLIAEEQTTGTVILQSSDDDYATWETLGTFDLTQKDKRILGCGAYHGGRAYRLQHATNAPFRAEALEIEYEATA